MHAPQHASQAADSRPDQALPFTARATFGNRAVMTFGLMAHCHGCAVHLAVRHLPRPAVLMQVMQVTRPKVTEDDGS